MAVEVMSSLVFGMEYAALSNLAVGMSCIALSAALVRFNNKAEMSTDAPAGPSAAAPQSKTLGKSSSCWEVKMTETKDVYYLNRDTGETVWEKPDDYIEDEVAAVHQRRRLSLAPVTGDTNLRDGLELLDIYGTNAQQEVAAMKSGQSAGEKCLMRLHYLDDLFENARKDEEEDWFELVQKNDYELAATIYGYLCPNCPFDVRLVVCRLLDRFCKLEENIGMMIVTERWGKLSFLLDQVHSGIEHTVSVSEKSKDERDEQMKALYAWFLLLEELFSATFTSAQSEINCLHHALLPKAPFFYPIFSAMEDCTKEVFLMSCRACLAISYHYPSISENQFAMALLDRDQNRRFGEALMHLLNQQSAPYENGLLLKQILKCIADLLSDSSSRPYFYTNDLVVVVDICIREISNLDAADSLRVDYLTAISLVLRSSFWAEKTEYRRDEIKNIVSSVANGKDSYDEKAVVAANIVLTECHLVLDAVELEAAETLHV